MRKSIAIHKWSLFASEKAAALCVSWAPDTVRTLGSFRNRSRCTRSDGQASQGSASDSMSSFCSCLGGLRRKRSHASGPYESMTAKSKVSGHPANDQQVMMSERDKSDGSHSAQPSVRDAYNSGSASYRQEMLPQPEPPVSPFSAKA